MGYTTSTTPAVYTSPYQPDIVIPGVPRTRLPGLREALPLTVEQEHLRQMDYDAFLIDHATRLAVPLHQWRPQEGRARRGYYGYRDEDSGDWITRVRTFDDASHGAYVETMLWEPDEIRGQHSWGYSGEGPHRLAFDLLCDALQERPLYKPDISSALSLAHFAQDSLVRQLIAWWDQDNAGEDRAWWLPGKFLDTWLIGWIATHPQKVEDCGIHRANYLEDWRQGIDEKNAYAAAESEEEDGALDED